jgi:hypothetical protein
VDAADQIAVAEAALQQIPREHIECSAARRRSV